MEWRDLTASSTFAAMLSILIHNGNLPCSQINLSEKLLGSWTPATFRLVNIEISEPVMLVLFTLKIVGISCALFKLRRDLF